MSPVESPRSTAVPEPAPDIEDVGLLRLRQPAHRVSRRAVRWWSARIAMVWAVILAGQLVWWTSTDTAGDVHMWVFVGSVVLAVAEFVIEPRWRYRVHHWEVTDDAVYTKSGWLSQEWRIAPLSRVQTVDSHRGPFERMMGLATVAVTTASAAGAIHIEGLDQEVAEPLVDRLTRAARAAREDAT
jgi:membrane protein YdbS with pleckstrin-like domain